MPNSFSTHMSERIRQVREEIGQQIYKRRASISKMEIGTMYPDTVDLVMMASAVKNR